MKKLFLFFAICPVIFWSLYCNEDTIEIEIPTPTPTEATFTYPELTGNNQFGTIYQVKFNHESSLYDHNCQSETGLIFDNDIGQYAAGCEDEPVSMIIALSYLIVNVYDCSDDDLCCIGFRGADGTDYWSCDYEGSGTVYVDHIDGGYVEGQFFGKLYSVYEDYYEVQNGYFSGYTVH